MDPSTFYEKMISEISDDDRKAIARIFLLHVGQSHKISIGMVAIQTYGQSGASNIRKARQVIEELIEEHAFPICSQSGKAGRWLAGSKEEAEAAANEREARANKLILSARKLRSAWLPAGMPVIRTAVQPELMTYYSGTLVPMKTLLEKDGGDDGRI